MRLNDAPNIEKDLIQPMEDLSSKLKDLLLSLGGFIQKSSGYFGILFAPSIVYILVFHFGIYDLFLEKNSLYNSSIITGSTALILGYWLYKSALFANKHDKIKDVIKDNLLSLITLSLLIYDISINFIAYNISIGFTKEQFYAEKWLIIVFVTLDFILGVKAGYYYYKNDYDAEVIPEDENQNIDILNNDLEEEEENIDELDEIDDNSYNSKKMLKFFIWSIVVMVIIMSGFYIYNGSS